MSIDRRRLLQSAQKFVMKGQIRKAISDYEKLVADDPKNIRIRTKLADLYVRNHDVDLAVEEYVQLAKQYEYEDLSYRAISMYKKVLTLRPKMINVHYWLADLYRKEGLVGNAKVLYHNIIKLNPQDQVARRGISEIDQILTAGTPLQRQNEVPTLVESPVHVSQEQTELPEEPLILDDVLEAGTSSPEEITADRAIVELEDPLDLPAQTHESTENNEQDAENNPLFTHQKVDLDEHVSPEKDLESHYHLGIAYMEMDLIDQAIAEFEAALGYGPKRVDCLVMLGHCYTEKGVPDRSILYLEKALGLEGLTQEEHVRINKELGRVYETCGMKEKAGEAFKRAGLTPENSGRLKS